MEIKPGEYEGYLYLPAKRPGFGKMMLLCLVALLALLLFCIYSGYSASEIFLNMIVFGSIIVISFVSVSGAVALSKKIRNSPQLLVSVNDGILRVASSGTNIISVSTAACVFKDAGKSLKKDKRTNQIIIASIPSKYRMRLNLLLVPVEIVATNSKRGANCFKK